jgi:protein-disulfide isomerase
MQMPGVKRRFLNPLIAFISLAGAGVSVWQTYSYLQILGGVGPSHSFCDLSQIFDCTTVEMSKYAEFLPGFPLSGMAIAGYLFIFILSVWKIFTPSNENLKKPLIILSGISVIFTVVYFTLMLQIGKLCLLCLVVDLLNILLFIAAVNLPQNNHSNKFRSLPFLSVGIVSLVFAFLVVKGLDPQVDERSADSDDIVESVMNSPVQNIDIPSDAEVVGPANAKVTIIEFGDFQCPPCKLAAASIAPLFKRYGVKLRFVFLNFPWATECNSFPNHTGHSFACEAAAVAMCANEQGRFLEAYENLFENQIHFETGKIDQLLESSLPSLDTHKLRQCLNSRILDKVRRDADIGIQQKVNSTPTFFINGRRTGALPTKIWIKIIDHVLGS